MDIFLSYASEQRAIAEEIALALRSEGHEVFFDRSELPDGEAYNARIREALSGCALLIFLVSPQSIAEGRYTLTELRFAQEKWPAPAGRVLPVVVQPISNAQVPAYLRAVSMLRPAGNVAAETVAAVHRLLMPRWRRMLRRYAPAIGALGLLAGVAGAWYGAQYWRGCGEATRLSAEAQLAQDAGDYAAAWGRYDAALAACPRSRATARGQERLAMLWLDNIRITVGKETFSDVVGKLQPVLSRASQSRDPTHAADALAHLGWGDMLRGRDGQRGLDPVRYYQQALQRDPANAYAHAFWGHYLMSTGSDLAAGKAHFEQALAASASRPFVRELQFGATLWRRDYDRDEDAVRIANDMRAGGEAMPPGAEERLAGNLWSVYHSRLVRGDERDRFLQALPAPDHLATYLWLFPRYDNRSNREPYRFMLAQLQENSGARAEAAANYRALLEMLTARGEKRGRMVDASRAALKRLSQ
jgi:hypothetical protein